MLWVVTDIMKNIPKVLATHTKKETSSQPATSPLYRIHDLGNYELNIHLVRNRKERQESASSSHHNYIND